MMTAAHQNQESLITGAWSVHDLLSGLSVAGGSLMGGTNCWGLCSKIQFIGMT